MFANSFGRVKNVCCGLVKQLTIVSDEWQEEVQVPIPLLSVDVNVKMVHCGAEVVVVQQYENKEQQEVQVMYYFPTNPEMAITQFKAEIGDQVIRSAVKHIVEAERNNQRCIYNSRMGLANDDKTDLVQAYIGKVEPGEKVKMTVGYVTELKTKLDGKKISLLIPTTIAPRYILPTGMDVKSVKIRKQGFASTPPAQVNIKVEIMFQNGIASIESPTHTIQVGKVARVANNTCTKVRVKMVGRTDHLNMDFMLNVTPRNMHKVCLYAETNEGPTNGLMLHYAPSFKQEQQKSEFIFMLDRSDSMRGKSIVLARKALELFMHSLPTDCHFNVVSYGSNHKFLFPQSVKYNERSLKLAIDHLEILHADMGEADMFEPLTEIFKKPSIAGYFRQIFVIACSGEALDIDGVIGLVQSVGDTVRLFTIGIGVNVQRSLFDGIAKAGGGLASFVTYHERIDTKIVEHLKTAIKPSLTNIRVEWNNKPVIYRSIRNPPMNYFYPQKIRPVYSGSQMVSYAILPIHPRHGANILATSPDEEIDIKVNEPLENLDVETGRMLHCLAAYNVIREKELEITALQTTEDDTDESVKEKDAQKHLMQKQIIDLGCKLGISSKYSAMVLTDDIGRVLTANWVKFTRYTPPLHNERIRNKSRKRRFNDTSVQRAFDFSLAVPYYSRKDHIQDLLSRINPYGSREESRRHDHDEDDSATKLMYIVARMQAFDGSFNLYPKLCMIVDETSDTLQAVGQERGLDDRVLATALAMSILSKKLASEKDRWELIAAKGHKWLASQVPPEKLDDILDFAVTVL